MFETVDKSGPWEPVEGCSKWGGRALRTWTCTGRWGRGGARLSAKMGRGGYYVRMHVPWHLSGRS